jgi:hypothetical protein
MLKRGFALFFYAIGFFLHPVVNMKTITFLVIAFMLFSSFAGQKKDRLYVYDQKVVGGKQAYITDSIGNAKKAGSNVNTRYFIYLGVPVQKELRVTELWIQGKPYLFSYTVAETPVLVKRQFPGEKKYDTLVAASDQKVYKISHNDIITDGNLENRKTAVRYPVVIYYTLNGKKCSIKTKNIDHLPEVMMQ